MPVSRPVSGPVFGLIDCNNFFASCERILAPKLKGTPVVVLSNNDGVIIARSQEAKDLGIEMGAVWYKTRRFCQDNGVQVFSSNYAFYDEVSRRVMMSLRHFSPRIEVYSVDEAFVDLTGGKALDRQGRIIQQTLRQWTGVPVSVGIAETKTLAKIANRLAKRSKKTGGVLDLTCSKYQDRALAKTPIGDVWGVGRRWGRKLETAGFQTALDLKHADDQWILKKFNVVLLRTVLELRGESCLPISTELPPNKTIIRSLSFGRYIETLPEMRQAMATYAADAASRMRSEGLAAREVSVFIRTNRFAKHRAQYRNSYQIKLPFPTVSTHEIIKAAIYGLELIFRESFEYKSCGIILSDLISAAEQQTSLLEPHDKNRIENLMKAVDRINHTYGYSVVRYGSEGFRKPWFMRRDRLSSTPQHKKVAATPKRRVSMRNNISMIESV